MTENDDDNNELQIYRQHWRVLNAKNEDVTKSVHSFDLVPQPRIRLSNQTGITTLTNEATIHFDGKPFTSPEKGNNLPLTTTLKPDTTTILLNGEDVTETCLALRLPDALILWNNKIQSHAIIYGRITLKLSLQPSSDKLPDWLKGASPWLQADYLRDYKRQLEGQWADPYTDGTVRQLAERASNTPDAAPILGEIDVPPYGKHLVVPPEKGHPNYHDLAGQIKYIYANNSNLKIVVTSIDTDNNGQLTQLGVSADAERFHDFISKACTDPTVIPQVILPLHDQRFRAQLNLGRIWRETLNAGTDTAGFNRYMPAKDINFQLRNIEPESKPSLAVPSPEKATAELNNGLTIPIEKYKLDRLL